MKSEEGPCRNPACVRYTTEPHVHCQRCGCPARTDDRCDYCGYVLCWSCRHAIPRVDIPFFDEDYEIICEPCIGREYGVYYDLDALEDVTVLPCGHSVVHLYVPDQGPPHHDPGYAHCRICYQED